MTKKEKFQYTDGGSDYSNFNFALPVGITMIVFLPFMITLFGFWGSMTWDTWLALGAYMVFPSYLVWVGK